MRLLRALRALPPTPPPPLPAGLGQVLELGAGFPGCVAGELRKSARCAGRSAAYAWT